MSGVNALNEPSGYTIDNSGNITIPQGVKDAVVNSALTVGPPGTTATATANCRCPAYDFSLPDETGLLSCNHSEIRACEFLPEIILSVTGSTPIDYFVGNKYFVDTISRSAKMIAK